MCNCNCRYNCLLLSIIASLIIGVITAFLRITAVITVTPAFLWVSLGIAVVYLAINLISVSAFRRYDVLPGCICPLLSVLLTRNFRQQV